MSICVDPEVGSGIWFLFSLGGFWSVDEGSSEKSLVPREKREFITVQCLERRVHTQITL